jgi:hypothetical protein
MMRWLLVLDNALAMAVAVLVAGRLFPRGEPWRRALAVAAGFPVIVVLTLLLLGTTGLLSAAAAAVVLALAAGGLLLTPRSRPPAPAAPGERAPEGGATGRVLFALAFALLAHTLWYYVYRGAVRGTFFSYDDLRYHAPAAAQWLQDGRLSLAPASYHATYPFNAELVPLWFMLPLGQDALASLSGLVWTAVALLSMLGLARSQGLGGTAGVLGAALFLASSVVMYAAGTFAAVDMACAVPVLAAVAFAAPVARDGPRAGWPSALFCGLMVGLAVGARSSSSPCAIVLGLWWLGAHRRDSTLACRVRLTCVYAAGAVLTGAFFYARTAWLTGNPLFPAALGPFAGPFDTEQSGTKLISWILERPFDGELWARMVTDYTDWPLSLFLASAVGYLAALVTLVRGRLRGVRLLLLCLGGVLIVLHPLMPFSATFNRPDGPLRIRPRYVVAAYGIGTMLFLFLLSGGPRRKKVWAGLGIAAVGLAMPAIEVRVAVLAAGLTVGYFLDNIARVLRPVPVRWLLAAGALVGLLFLVPEKQRRTDEEVHEYGNKHEPIGAVWQALEDLPAGSRIAWVGGHSHPYYPLFGRRLQLRPVALDRDGTPAVPLHVRWRRDPDGTAWWEDEKEPPLDGLMANLLATEVDYVLVSRWRRPDWPAQYHVLKGSGQAEAVYDDGFSAIWRFRRKTRSPVSLIELRGS